MFSGETPNGGTGPARGGNAIHVWIIPLANSPAAIHECLLWLDDYEVARMRSLQFVVDRIMYVESHSWLRRLLSEFTGIAPSTLRFNYPRMGKPALGLRSSEGMPDVRFSLSHTEGCAAIAIANEGDVGVDVERVRALDDLDDMGLAVLHPSERARLRGMESFDRHQSFFRAWTAKEAYTKALGRGLAHSFDKLSVTLSETSRCDIEDENIDVPLGRFNHWSMLVHPEQNAEFALGVTSLDGGGAVILHTVARGSRPTDAIISTSFDSMRLC